MLPKAVVANLVTIGSERVANLGAGNLGLHNQMSDLLLLIVIKCVNDASNSAEFAGRDF